MNKVALITGITGQDGACLAEFLLKKDYVVHGLKRRTPLFITDRLEHLYQDPHIDGAKFFLHFGDMTNSTNLVRLIQELGNLGFKAKIDLKKGVLNVYHNFLSSNENTRRV